MFLRRAVYSLFVSSTICFSAPPSCVAQHSHHESNPPVKINGKFTPELVPLDVAYHHFLLSLSVPTKATADSHPKDFGRREALLRRLNLEPENETRVLVEAQQFARSLEIIVASLETNAVDRSASSAVRESRFLQLRQQQQRVIQQSVQNLKSSLSGGARDAIDQYVRDVVRPRIVIYGN